MPSKQTENTAEKYYKDAIRYLNNARDQLKKAKKNGKYYEDRKYVRISCGTAYNAVLLALNGYFKIKNIASAKRRMSIDYYRMNLSKTDKKILNSLNDVYQILHLDGYYDGYNKISIIKDGFEEAEYIIGKLKQAL